MKRQESWILPAVVLFSLVSFRIVAEEKVDLQAITRIRDEAFNRSQVMETAWYLTDRYGPRLTGSPQLKAAAEWARGHLAEWGLENAALEPWGEFGRGWSFEKVCLEMTAPTYMPMIAYPEAWTPGTAGVISGEPVLLGDLRSESDLEPFKGKLAGKIVLLGGARDVQTPFEAIARRYAPQELEDIAKVSDPSIRSRSPASPAARAGVQPGMGRPQGRVTPQGSPPNPRGLLGRLIAEKVVAVLRPGGMRGDYGVTFVGGGGSYRKDAPPGLPDVVVDIEHYNRLVRLLQRKAPVSVSLEVKATFHDQDPVGFNIVAEIPGADPELKGQVVLVGAHFDSWHTGTGATDDASGCAVAMEALRIIKASGLRPRRTIRVGLWSGEEQGLLGSRGYVRNHFMDPESMEVKPEHARLSAYFNIDNGGGKIRGVYCQGNAAVRPVFAAWLEPFQDLGAATVTLRDTGGTDHLSFDRAGLPGFQFIQEPLDYSSRTHHSNMDTYERLIPGDLAQASAVLASFAYHAAMRDELLPRKAPPSRPARGGGAEKRVSRRV
jgi:carboxypeptidase Q